MSETANGTPNGTQRDQTQVAVPPLVVNAQYLKDFSFENPNAPGSLMALERAPEVEISVGVNGRSLAELVGPDSFEVVLSVTATAHTDGKPAFVVEVVYGGVFTVNGVPPEHVRPVLLIEGPRLLFPFVRNLIATATREGGFPALSMQPIDFVGLYQSEFAGGGGID